MLLLLLLLLLLFQVLFLSNIRIFHAIDENEEICKLNLSLLLFPICFKWISSFFFLVYKRAIKEMHTFERLARRNHYLITHSNIFLQLFSSLFLKYLKWIYLVCFFFCLSLSCITFLAMFANFYSNFFQKKIQDGSVRVY